MKCFQPSSTFLNLEPYPLKVSQNLGLQHILHEEVIGKHTKPVAQTLFGDTGNLQVAILVLDGTYTYIQKKKKITISISKDVHTLSKKEGR